MLVTEFRVLFSWKEKKNKKKDKNFTSAPGQTVKNQNSVPGRVTPAPGPRLGPEPEPGLENTAEQHRRN